MANIKEIRELKPRIKIVGEKKNTDENRNSNSHADGGSGKDNQFESGHFEEEPSSGSAPTPALVARPRVLEERSSPVFIPEQRIQETTEQASEQERTNRAYNTGTRRQVAGSGTSGGTSGERREERVYMSSQNNTTGPTMAPPRRESLLLRDDQFAQRSSLLRTGAQPFQGQTNFQPIEDEKKYDLQENERQMQMKRRRDMM